MAKKEETNELFTVGPHTQFIAHTKDQKNYWPGQTFTLDHVTAEVLQRMLDRGQVVNVTGKSQAEIDAMVKAYKPFTQTDVKQAMKAAFNG